MKRNLTHREETALRLVHHDFGGESIKDAAVYMDVTPKCVREHLRNAKRKAPQLFPILTPQHRTILAMRDQHISHEDMAAELGLTTTDKLERNITFLREHRFLFDQGPNQYRPSIDSQVKEKF